VRKLPKIGIQHSSANIRTELQTKAKFCKYFAKSLPKYARISHNSPILRSVCTQFRNISLSFHPIRQYFAHFSHRKLAKIVHTKNYLSLRTCACANKHYFPIQQTGEKTVQISIRQHKTLELAQDKNYLVSCGKFNR
jgi:hypothetical protein